MPAADIVDVGGDPCESYLPSWMALLASLKATAFACSHALMRPCCPDSHKSFNTLCATVGMIWRSGAQRLPSVLGGKVWKCVFSAPRHASIPQVEPNSPNST